MTTGTHFDINCQIKQIFLLVSGFFFLALPQSRAAVVVTGDPVAGTGVITLTQDITFNVTTFGYVAALVFDEWVVNDGVRDFRGLSPSSFSYTLNGGGILSNGNLAVYDNLNASSGDITANDGYFFFFEIFMSPGDIFVFKAGTWNIPATPGFNPDAVGTFTGNVFITDSGGNAFSALTPVPEPSAAILLLVGSGLCFRRRRI